MVTQYQVLTDAQCGSPPGQVIINYLPVQRKRQLELREVVNAILYILRTGCQWRNLPINFPPWSAVYYYFYRWKQDGCLERMNLALNKVDRVREGREPTPSLICVDSQSRSARAVKLSPRIFEDRGIDGSKNVNGRKKQIAVDAGGRIWATYVHAANEPDSRAACHLLWYLRTFNQRLEKVLTDQAYKAGPPGGRFAERVIRMGLIFEIASKPPSFLGFVPCKKRWVVERTFSWLNYYRRVTKDYEYTAESSEAWILWTNCVLILNRL